jgi:hypothetical protein
VVSALPSSANLAGEGALSAPGRLTELVPEIIPGVRRPAADTAASLGEVVSRLTSALRSHEQRDASANREAYRHARGEDSDLLPVEPRIAGNLGYHSRLGPQRAGAGLPSTGTLGGVTAASDFTGIRHGEPLHGKELANNLAKLTL